MKLGVTYNVFDDSLELLKASIECIRKEINHINIVYQKKSNHGNPCIYDIESYLNHLKEIGLIDSIIEYLPQININSNLTCHSNEFNKRMLGYQYIKNNTDCNYFLSMDSDEMYDKKDFKKIINKIEKKNYSSTSIMIQDYHKLPTYQIKTFANYYVPFIHKMDCIPTINQNFYCYCDPTRKVQVVDNNYKIILSENIIMHHMTTIRLDLSRKYSNSSALINFKNDIEKKINDIKYYNPDSLDNNIEVNVLKIDKFNVLQSIGYFKAFFGIV